MKVCGKRDVYLPPCEDSCEIGTLNVGSNGTYDAESAGYDGYGEVRVNVPNSYTYADNGKVVQNGALVSQSSREISDNGEYDTTTNNRVLVNVAEGDTVEYTPIQTSGDELGTITINGESQTIYGVDYSGKQDALVSGTNIKTVNSTSLLGSGDVTVQPTLVSGTNIKTVNNTSLLGSGNVAVQPTLVSGTNIKTINNESLLGSGNISIQSGTPISTETVTITVANWNATTTCTKSVTGVTASNSVIVSPAPASMTAYTSSGVYCSAQASGTLTFTASSTPTADITVNIVIIG